MRASRILTLVSLIVALAGGTARAANGEEGKPPQGAVEPSLPTPFGISDIANLPEGSEVQSIGRADFLACSQLGRARAFAPGDVDRQAFARALNGTWVRELTWYGVQIPTESVLYFDLQPTGGVAMMYDLVYVGLGPMSRRVDVIKSSLEVRARTPTLTYVYCTKGIHDRYYKVSDDMIYDGLSLLQPRPPLAEAWRQLVAQGYFDRSEFDMPQNLFAKPGSELLTPSVVGAFWRVRLDPVAISGYTGVRLQLSGEYRGSHWAPGEVETGVESGDFIREGDLYVAADEYMGDDRAAGAPGNYVNKVDPNSPIVMERVVLDPP